MRSLPNTAAHYRPDIDGLRAFAVLAVIAFHADIRQFHGGFIGVDVFFVVSGYLISGIIFRALEKKSFSFTEFYVRRIVRIFPALIVLLLATCAIGWAVLFSNEFATLGKQTIAGAGFSSNFLLWSEAGYFDSAKKPLLHLWSLGVEEQFYIFWPVASLVLWKARRHLMAAVFLIMLASFALNVWQASGSRGIAAFYSPLTRVWELSAGTMLFLLQSGESRGTGAANSSHRVLTTIASVAGLSLFVVALWKVDKDTAWPGWFALVPVAATALILGAGERSPVNRLVFGNPVAVWIGLISYPLYLWHWPLLVFAKLLYWGAVPWTARITVVGASFALAYATFRIVELPIRTGSRRRRSAVILAFAMVSVAALGFTMMTAGIKPRLHAYSEPELAWNDWTYPSERTGLRDGTVQPNTLPGDPSRRVVMIGDSHIEQYYPRIALLSSSSGKNQPEVTFLTYRGCPPVPGLERRGIASQGGHFECSSFIEKALRVADSPSASTVVITAFWDNYWDGRMYSITDTNRRSLGVDSPATDSAFMRLEGRLAAMVGAGKRVYIVLSNPSGHEFDPESFFPARLPGFPAGNAVGSISADAYTARTSAIRGKLQEMARRSGATIIDPLPYLCPNGSCPTRDERGNPIYRDEDHMRASFVRNNVTFMDRVVSLSR